MCAQIAQRHFARKRVLDESSGGRRQQNLATVTHRGDSSGAVNLIANETRGLSSDLAGVNTHAHT